MTINLSKPLLLGLLISLMVSIILLLEPELPSFDDQIMIDRGNIQSKQNDEAIDYFEHDRHVENSWIRILESVPILSKDIVDQPPVPVPPPVVIEQQLEPQMIEELQQPIAPIPQYAYVGRLIDGDRESLFLLSPSDAIVTKKGEILQGEWQVQQATETSLDLTYLPLNTTYRLTLK